MKIEHSILQNIFLLLIYCIWNSLFFVIKLHQILVIKLYYGYWQLNYIMLISTSILCMQDTGQLNNIVCNLRLGWFVKPNGIPLAP